VAWRCIGCGPWAGIAFNRYGVLVLAVLGAEMRKAMAVADREDRAGVGVPEVGAVGVPGVWT
jgi:hypothetical protein